MHSDRPFFLNLELVFCDSKKRITNHARLLSHHTTPRIFRVDSHVACGPTRSMVSEDRGCRVR
jgi:hypothetical protein